MELWLALTSFDEMEKAHDYPIKGVLTNPTILSRLKLNWKDIIIRLNSIGNLPLGLQVVSTTEKEMKEEIRVFRKLVDDKELICKIPICRDGLKVVPFIKKMGHMVNMAAICTFNQAVVSLETDIDYLSIYVGRVTDSGADGLNLIKQVKDYAVQSGKTTKIQAASIRNLEQFQEAAIAGADAIVVPFPILEGAVKSEMTDMSIINFTDDWAAIQ